MLELEVMIPLVLPHRIPYYFLDLNTKFKQNICKMQFIDYFYLKYENYKHREVKANMSFFISIVLLPRFTNLIF